MPEMNDLEFLIRAAELGDDNAVKAVSMVTERLKYAAAIDLKTSREVVQEHHPDVLPPQASEPTRPEGQPEMQSAR